MDRDDYLPEPDEEATVDTPMENNDADDDEQYNYEGRLLVGKIGKERLLEYAQEIIRRQRTPLHEIIRDHALPFLPVRSLHRFRDVSSSWNRHISTPMFAHTQTLSNRSASGIFLVDDKSSISSCYYPFEPTSANAIPDPLLSFLPCTQVKASSHGLLCCTSMEIDESRIWICNPATRESWSFPNPQHRDRFGMALVFDPSHDICSDYSIVSCYHVTSMDPTSVTVVFDVFSSKDGRWRSPVTLDMQQRLLSIQGVSVGGKAHWKSTNGTIVRLDPVTHMTNVLKIPEVAGGWSTEWELGEHDGKLCCAVRGWHERKLSMFVLEEARWTCIGSLEMNGDERVLGMEGGEVLTWLDGMMTGRNVVTKGWRVLCTTLVSEDLERSKCVPYVSSLAPVKRI